MTETLRQTFHQREVWHVANMAQPEREKYMDEYERSPLHSAQDTAKMRIDVARSVLRLKAGA